MSPIVVMIHDSHADATIISISAVVVGQADSTQLPPYPRHIASHVVGPSTHVTCAKSTVIGPALGDMLGLVDGETLGLVEGDVLALAEGLSVGVFVVASASISSCSRTRVYRRTSRRAPLR